MGMMGPASNMGDFVYSQEGLDRIVSQLMEQTSTSNAPGPATQADIDALPRTNVTEEMLGEEHKAECSICMDEVNIGEQVTLLPCKHWFHHPCVSAWLLEHDTCPHCRKGITKGGEGQTNNPASADSQTDRTSQMPGSFTPSGSGTFNDPYVVPAGSPPPHRPTIRAALLITQMQARVMVASVIGYAGVCLDLRNRDNTLMSVISS